MPVARARNNNIIYLTKTKLSWTINQSINLPKPTFRLLGTSLHEKHTFVGADKSLQSGIQIFFLHSRRSLGKTRTIKSDKNKDIFNINMHQRTRSAIINSWQLQLFFFFLLLLNAIILVIFEDGENFNCSILEIANKAKRRHFSKNRDREMTIAIKSIFISLNICRIP